MTAYFFAITVGISQLSMLFLWYYDILHNYCKTSTFPTLEKSFSLLFPIIFIRCEVGRLNFAITQLEKDVKKSMTKVANDPSNQSIASKHTQLVLKLEKMKQKALSSDRIQGKMKTLMLALGNFPQSLVTIALLVLAINNDRMKRYLVNERIKGQASLMFDQYFQYIVCALIIKTILSLVFIILKNR